MSIVLLHTNDFHGRLVEPKISALRAMREEADFYFDTGDCIKAGNLGIPLRPEEVWPVLGGLHCTASVLGNRESHVLDGAFRKKLEGAQHPLLAGNLHKRDGSHPLPGVLKLEAKGLRVGVLAVMVPMVTAAMATQAASAYLWDAPIPVAKALAAELRPQVDLLIALTHIGYAQDRKLAEACGDIDIILGGHSHTILEAPEKVGRTWICQGGSHGRFVGRYVWEPDGGLLTGGLTPLPETERRTGR